LVTLGRQGESRCVMRIAFYRLPEQIERPKKAPQVKWVPLRECAQVEVERCKIVCRPVGGAVCLGRF